MVHAGKSRILVALSLLSLTVLVPPASAVTPQAKFPLTFTTTLRPGATYSCTLSIWDASTGGNQIGGWSESSVKLTVASNRTVYYVLGTKKPLPPLDFTQQYWVQLRTGTAKFRTRLPAAGYAFWSDNVNTAPLDRRYVEEGQPGAVGPQMIADGAVTAQKVGSAGTLAGKVLMADGAGGATWQSLSALETEIANLKTENASQGAHITGLETEIANLKTANAVQDAYVKSVLLGTAPVPSGQTVTGYALFDHSIVVNSEDVWIAVRLPGRAAAPLTEATVNFANDPDAVDDDASCTGTAQAPTAPPGKVCLYLAERSHVTQLRGWPALTVGFEDQFFLVRAIANGVLGDDLFFRFSWAYQAP